MKSRVIVTLMLLMLVVTLQSVFLLPAVNAATHTDITVAKAYDMIYSTDYPNLLVMDVRAATSPPEGTPNFNDEHILGAINVPVLPPPPFDFAALNAWISSPEGQSHKNHEIIVYCPMEGCPRSNMASNILDANGFTKVYDMLGGYLAWTVAGYPIIHVTAAVDITPETLNLKSNGKWVTCYIELPTPNSVNDIVVSTIKLCGSVSAASKPTQIARARAMVKFDRTAVQGLLGIGEKRLWITFEVGTGAARKLCGGWDSIMVIG